MVQVGELQRITKEEYRRVVAYKVPVAGVGVELHGESSDVTLCICSSTLSCHSGKTHEAQRLFSHFGKYRGTGILSDVMSDCECAVGSRTLCMHSSFGDDLSVEMGHLFEKPCVLQCNRPAMPSSLSVLIVRDRASVLRGEMFLVVRFHVVKN